jgi:hypothetical protein
MILIVGSLGGTALKISLINHSNLPTFRPPYFRIMTCSNYAHQYSSTRSGALGKISGGYYRYDSPPPTPYFIINKNGLNNTLRHMLNGL